MAEQGFLAIWTRIEPENFSDYRLWLSREHIAQRIFSPGFLGARVHASTEDEQTHFILYATENKQVLQGTPYLEVLNNPTPWTQRMMPLLKDFDRAAGQQVVKVGDGTGAWLLVSKLFAPAEMQLRDGIETPLSETLEIDGIATARLYAVDRRSTDVRSEERRMRGGAEGAFEKLMVIEGMNEAAVVTVRAKINEIAHRLYGTEVTFDTSMCRLVYALHPFEGAMVKGRTESPL